MKIATMLVAVCFGTLIASSAKAANPPKLDFWRPDLVGGGLKLFQQVAEQAEKDGGQTALGGIAALVLLAATGNDLFPVKMKFSNPHSSTITVKPSRFRVSEVKNGSSHALITFIVQQNGKTAEWSSVKMPPGSSIELFGYYVAPKNFRAKLMTTLD